MQKWDDIQLILALLRKGSLSGAGQSLNIHVSTAGRRLDSFEEELGLQLFDRTPEGLIPTQAIQDILPWAEEVERRVMDVERELEGLETEAKGTVRVSTPPSIASLFLAPALHKFRKSHPRILLEIESTTSYVDLTRREADIALRSHRPTSGDLITKRIAQAKSSIFVSKKRAKEINAIKSLDEVPWLTYCSDLQHIPDASWIYEQVSPQNIAMRSNDISTQIAACKSGLGALVTADAVGIAAGLFALSIHPRAKKKLKALPEQELWLVGHRALRNVPRVKATWNFIAGLFKPPTKAN